MQQAIDEYQAGEAAKAAAPVRAKMKRPEDILHVACHRALKLALPFDALHQSHENRGEGSREGARRKARGVVAGFPDVQILYRGRSYFVELKADKGVLSPAQVAMHRRLRDAGFPVFVCRSVEDMLTCIREAGVPLRARVLG